VSSRHDRLALLDRYLRIPTISRQVTPAMVEAVRAFWADIGLELSSARARRYRHAGPVGDDSRAPPARRHCCCTATYDVQPTG